MTRPMRLLVFGATGQVARELIGTHAPDITMQAMSRNNVDLSDPQDCARVVQEAEADIVINAAAMTDVDRAEREEDLAITINGRAPGAMARAAVARGLPFIHLSTDFVFDGTADQPLDEDAPASPVNVYGRSKLIGEQEVMAAGGQPVIIRTTRVFAAHGNNFVRTMLAAARRTDRLQVVSDQYSGPTAATDIAGAIHAVVAAFRNGRGRPGIYHYSSLPVVNLFDFTVELFRQASWIDTPSIEPITSAQWPTEARRPPHPVLDCRRIAAAYALPQPDWREALSSVLAALREQDR